MTALWIILAAGMVLESFIADAGDTSLSWALTPKKMLTTEVLQDLPAKLAHLFE